MSSATLDILPKHKKAKKAYFQWAVRQGYKILPGVKTLFSEGEVAKFLDHSIYTQQRLRKNGSIGCCIISGKAFYTPNQINDYLENVSISSWNKGVSKLATIGSPSGPVPKPGMQTGTTPQPGKHDAVHLAQEIFGKPK
jgi:hypothetical protein